jgi:gliding motility-associated-like protein
MPFIAGCTYSAGNVFTIQLSNSTGSFASPVTLGSASRQTSGTINCYIPKNIASGSGYRMRLISSNPYFVTADNGFNIRINSSPVTQYTVNNPTQCFSNNNFIFNNTSTIASGSMTYLWKFGDNTTTNQSNPTHSYSNDSNYVVKLICTSDSGCKDSLSKNLQIYSSPKTGFSVNDFAQCLDNNVFYFNSTTSIKQGSFTILWNFGDGDTSKQNTPSHTYKTNNNFNVKLTAVSNNGCKDSTTKTMKILPSPVSQFSINDTGQCLSSNNFIFTNKTSILQGNISYLWHFGDGATSAAINPSHSYSIPSNYVVELIATSDSGCKDTFSQQIRLAALPSAGFSINTTPQCIKENKFILTNSSSVAFGTVKYLWDFGNGTTDTIKDPVYSYKTEGNYTIQLITTASVDCADTISKTVTVNPSPSTSFSINDSDQCFNGNNFIFTNTSTIKSGSLTYQWNFGDASTANGTNASHSFSVDQNFKVKLVSLSDLGCKDSITKNALIYSSPKSDYFVNDSDQCFSNNSFSFTNTSNIKTGSLKFRWLYGDSKSDTMRNPVHAYAKYGNYNVSLISTSNKNCRDTIIKMIYVYPLPVAGFSINNPVQCLKGNHFVFSNSSLIPSGSMTYRWAFGDGFQSTDTDPDHSYLAARTYDVFLYATSLFGCSDTFKSTVTVNMMPKANFTLTTICLNEPVAFTDRSFINAPDSIILWSWDFGDGSVSSDRNPSYIFSNSGTTGVRLIVTSNNGCRDTVSKPIYIRPHVSAPVIDRVSVREGVSSDIEIEWIPPKDGYIKNYLLEKSEDNFNYTVFSHPDRLATGYIDASVLTDSMPYYFRIKAIDSCSYGSDYSNYGKSILLHTSNKIHIAELKWTAYEEWAEGIDHYEIELFNTKNSSFIYVGSVDANTLEFFDDVTALNQSDYCYRVAAVRNNDGVKCYSNSDCVPVSFGCFIPNSFTPNGDSLNDVLLAVGTSVFKFTLSIYDRWGNLVFESNDMSIGWDGTHNGTKSPEGYYYYQMSARGIKNQKTVSKGSILLIR